MSPPLAAPLAALLAVALVCARADMTEIVEEASGGLNRSEKSLGPPALPPGCLYEGRWFADGSAVPTGEACLRCACFRGALTCRLRSCAPLPDPPPHRCHVLHRRVSCCPELHCTDGIMLMEHEASARFEGDDVIAAPPSIAHACVEGGTVYAAGSAMRSSVACEQCFCLGGARRCVRPRCLPPQPGCAPRPAPGACCPQRYYCDRQTTKPPEDKHPHDCKVDGSWITEGERVISPKTESNCTQCFCLRGSVQCQPLSCAPPLMGCKPLLRKGECCASQYHCEHSQHGSHLTLSNNALTSIRNDDRAFHTSKSKKHESTTKNTLANIFTVKNTPTLNPTKNHLISTTKVKRKTSDPPPDTSDTSSQAPEQNTTAIVATTTTPESTTVAKLISTTEAASTTDREKDSTTETTSTTGQPDGSVRVMINGTINCTTELSSTSLPLNVTFNQTDKIKIETHPRIPLIDVSNLEDNTFSPNDIITDRTVNGGFDEDETFVINVTSSLNTNTSNSSTKPTVAAISKVSQPTNIAEAVNSSKKTKGDYDYDYTEPTLPPSLPNLKIIPFVAADAVVEDDHSKETLTYPVLEREDKFPVYYASANPKDTAYATRREDVYRPTQYPVFITDKPDQEQYLSLTHDTDSNNPVYSDIHTDIDASVNEFSLSSNLGNHAPDMDKPVTQQPLTTTTLKLESPAVNLFSPPVETEGGFVPKGPTGLIDEYFAVFPSTPHPVPHLTTSMQLDIAKEECVSSDGRHVPEGAVIALACSECACAWGELHCSPRPCVTPSGCKRRPASNNAADLCCGELICDEDNITPELVANAADPSEVINKTESIQIDSVPHVDTIESIDQKNTTAQIDVLSKGTVNDTETTSVSSIKMKTVLNLTTTSTTTEILTTKSISTTTNTPVYKETNQNQSLEYEEEEEDDDDSFNFSSVLKLLLSGDSYETTTITPKKMTSTTKLPLTTKVITTTRKPRPTLPPFQPSKPAIAPFVPLPIHPYISQKKNQNSINRIDHLVLGESTAIRKTTVRPVTTSFKPITTNRPSDRPSTQRITTKPTEVVIDEKYTTQESLRPPGGLSGLGPGLLKLAGCNIYGRMYRVGRIIAELSTPCQECWCTELGVQCKQLKC